MKDFIIAIIVFLIIITILSIFSGIEFWICLIIAIGVLLLYIDLQFIIKKIKTSKTEECISEFFPKFIGSIKENPINSKKLDRILSKTRDMSLEDAITALCLPQKIELKGTVFYKYLIPFYSGKTELGVLKLIESTWEETVPVIHPLVQKMYFEYDIMDKQSEELLTKYPWILPL